MMPHRRTLDPAECAGLIKDDGSNRYFVDQDLDGYFREVAKHLGMVVR